MCVILLKFKGASSEISFWTNLLVFNWLVTINTYLLFSLDNKHEFEQKNKLSMTINAIVFQVELDLLLVSLLDFEVVSACFQVELLDLLLVLKCEYNGEQRIIPHCSGRFKTSRVVQNE